MRKLPGFMIVFGNLSSHIHLFQYSSNMAMFPRLTLTVILLCVSNAVAQNGWNSSAPSLTFPPMSGYSTKVFNISAATTTLTYDYSDEELAMLWNQVGKIEVGPVTTTVYPTPEPSAYPRPGVMHPMVCQSSPDLITLFLIATGSII